MLKSTQQSKAQHESSKAKGGYLYGSGGSRRARGRPSKREASPTVPVGVIAKALAAVSTGREARLCGNLSTLIWHINARIYDKHGVHCVYYGLDLNWK
jgi:hypothetical protein